MKGVPYCATPYAVRAIPGGIQVDPAGAVLIPVLYAVDLSCSVVVDTFCLPADLVELRKKGKKSGREAGKANERAQRVQARGTWVPDQFKGSD
jgi:hypothetical protein